MSSEPYAVTGVSRVSYHDGMWIKRTRCEKNMGVITQVRYRKSLTQYVGGQGEAYTFDGVGLEASDVLS